MARADSTREQSRRKAKMENPKGSLSVPRRATIEPMIIINGKNTRLNRMRPAQSGGGDGGGSSSLL